MASFSPLNHRDFNARIERYNMTDKRCEYMQVASYAHIARHPLARSPIRRQLLPDEFQLAGNGLFTITDCPVFV